MGLYHAIEGFTGYRFSSEVFTLRDFEYGENAYIPYRNLIYAAIASNFGNRIFIIGIKGDRVEDKNPKAYDEMSRVLNRMKKPDAPKVKVDSPFWDRTKTDIINWFIHEVGEKKASLILKTSVSCYDEKTLGSCGECKSCLRKAVALKYCGIDCENWFESDITKNPYIETYIREMTSDNPKYDERRIYETLQVFREWGYNV